MHRSILRLVLLPLAASLLVHRPAPAQPVPQHSLRIGTYNAYLLSPFFKCTIDPICHADIAGQTEEWAHRLADTILADVGRLDIVAINEAWDEDAKAILVSRLRNAYPVYVQDIDADLVQIRTTSLPLAFPTGVKFNGEDSGLMLFAREDFRVLPLPDARHQWGTGGRGELTASHPHVAFTLFDECASDDCMAAKGAALVRLQHRMSGRVYNVVFTHLQADYPPEEYAPVRAAQFAQVERLVRESLAPLQGRLGTETILLLGDLNVPFLRDDEEWRRLFTDPESFFSRPLYEAWTQTSSPRDSTATHDEEGERYDYVFASPQPFRPGVRRPAVCVQHMTVPLAFQALESDHSMVHADLNHGFYHCSPSLAYNVQLARPGDVQVIDQHPSNPAEDVTRIVEQGAMQWFLVQGGGTGTYTIGTDNENLRVDVYLPEDLTTPVSRYNETPGTPRPSARRSFAVDQYVLPELFYVRVRGRNRRTTGDYSLLVRRHGCATKADACLLQPGTLQTAFLSGQQLPPGQLQPQDRAWFRFDVTGETDAGRPQTITLTASLHDQTRVSAAIDELTNTAPGEELRRSEMTNIVSFTGKAGDASRGYLVVSQSAPAADETPIRVTMNTNLRFLEVGELRCMDETDPEAGSDDIVTFFTIDGVTRRAPAAGEVEFDCDNSTDAKQWAPRLGNAVVAYTDGVAVRISEQDDVSANDASRTRLVPDLPHGANSDSGSLSWSFEGGTYKFNYTVRMRLNEPVADAGP